MVKGTAGVLHWRPSLVLPFFLQKVKFKIFACNASIKIADVLKYYNNKGSFNEFQISQHKSICVFGIKILKWILQLCIYLSI